MSTEHEHRCPRPKARRYNRKAFASRQVNLGLLNKKLMTVLMRDTEALMGESYKGPLQKDRSEALAKYLRLLKQLKQLEAEDMKELSEEELKKLAGDSE